MKLSTRQTGCSGFSLVEVILVIFIVAISVLALYALFNIALKMVWENKARIGATQLANQKLELAQNLIYDQVGTITGIPSGVLQETEHLELNGILYDIYTNVVYVDDPFDGLSPEDNLPTDYKKIKVTVSWDSNFSSSPVDFYTYITPDGLESNDSGGILSISVFDINANPVDLASVHIFNSTTGVDINSFTSGQGMLILPGVPPSSEPTYEITVTKDGYSSSRTYGVSAELPSPDPGHLKVFEGVSTLKSFSIDKTASLDVCVNDISGVGLSGIKLRLYGEKEIGDNENGDPVYKYDQELITGVNGCVLLEAIEWDSYFFEVVEGSLWDIADINPSQPFLLMPEDEAQINIEMEPNSNFSLLLVVKDINNNSINQAYVDVSNVIGYNQATTTSLAGQAFFSPLDEATTTIEVGKMGYATYTNDILLVGYTVEPVILIEE